MVARFVARFMTVVGIAAAAGCCIHQKPPKPLPQPTTLVSIGYFRGTALSGAVLPVKGTPAVLPSDSLSVRVTFIALENVPVTAYPPVGSRAVFFSSTGGGSAIMPAAELTRNATITDLNSPAGLPVDLRRGAAGRMTTVAALDGALPAGVTADFSMLDPVSITDPVTASPTRRSMEVLVSRPVTVVSPLQLALVLKDLVKNTETGAGGQSLCTEKAIFDLPGGDQTNTAMVVPFRFDDATSRAVAVLVQISPGTNDPANDPAHIAATLACAKQIDTARQATTQPLLSTGEASAGSTVASAVQSLTPVNGRRSSLAFLADQTGASLCEDLAMEADDAVIAELVRDIQAKVATNAEHDPNVGWLLDQTALKLLSKLSNDAANGTGKISPELSAILTNHTGEVGRHSSSLEDVLRAVSNRRELDIRLLAENTIFLEDSNPASRVRAFDWLNARHQAPAGYDPLGTPKSRREALERAAETP